MKWDFQRFPRFFNLPNFRIIFEGKVLSETLLYRMSLLNARRNTETRNGQLLISTVIKFRAYLQTIPFAQLNNKKQTNKHKEITEGSLNVGHEKKTTALSVIDRQLCIAGLVFFHGAHLK